MIHEAAFGERSPLGSSIYAEDLDSLSPAAVSSFRSTNFVASNLVVSLSGGVPHDQVKKMIETHFCSLPASKNNAVRPASPYIGGDRKVRINLGGETYMSLAFPTPAGEGGIQGCLISFAYKSIYQ
jgi:predicted Zn-dependent peptidase